MTFGQGWGKDYGSPYGFDFFVFNGTTISCNGSYDEGLLGHDRGAGHGVRRVG